MPQPPLLARAAAEVLGTFLLIFFGCGAVHVAVLTGDLAGLGQVAMVWGVAIMVAVYTCGGISGAHINPAITIALAVCGRFKLMDVPAYIIGQLAGAMLAAATLFALFNPVIEERERVKQIERGKPGSEITAMCYGEYFPSPGKFAGGNDAYDPVEAAHHATTVTEATACLAEFLGTFILALAVFAMTDDRNNAAPAARFAPVFIGLTVTILICVIAPLTQACFNPARDFGPRVVAWAAGWGEVAIPGPNGRGFFTVYIVAPIVGAIVGGALYTWLVQPCLPAPTPEGPAS